MRSVYDSILSKSALDPIAASAATNGIVIDTFGYNSATFAVQNGAVTGTPDSYTLNAKLQEGALANGSDMADVSGVTITQITADSKIAVIRVDGLGTTRKRYLRVVVTPALTGGTSPKALISAVANLGRAYKKPVGNAT